MNTGERFDDKIKPDYHKYGHHSGVNVFNSCGNVERDGDDGGSGGGKQGERNVFLCPIVYMAPVSFAFITKNKLLNYTAPKLNIGTPWSIDELPPTRILRNIRTNNPTQLRIQDTIYMGIRQLAY